MKSAVTKRSIQLDGRRTSVSLEDAFWTALKEIAHFQGVTVQPMIRSDGYELILGSSVDPQFGPVLLFGLGGELVEVFKDRALGLPPLNTVLARRMMELVTHQELGKHGKVEYPV